MATKDMKLPADEVLRRIEAKLGRFDRTPFHEQLSRAISCGPSKTSWRSLGRKAPDKWAQAIVNLARVSGFAERKETVNLTPDPKIVASELVARYGRENALSMLKGAGLPETLIPEVIEGEAVEVK